MRHDVLKIMDKPYFSEKRLPKYGTPVGPGISLKPFKALDISYLLL